MEKKEIMLNVALETSDSERQKTVDLNVGFNELDDTWELIVKTNGDISYIADKFPGTRVEILGGNYSIIVAETKYVDDISNEPYINYIEKPKNFYFGINYAKSSACINQVQITPYNLFGEGVLVAVLDSGIDIFHKDFRLDDGKTRIYELWDQTENGGTPPEGYLYGTLYERDMINAALEVGRIDGRKIVPSLDFSGHGTAVAGILAGNGNESEGKYAGIATKAELLIIKLGNANESFPKTTRIMEALDYSVKVAMKLQMPLVINLSFGNNYGAHNGNSILEEFVNYIAGQHKTTVVIGSGNEGSAGIHTSGRLDAESEQIIELAVGEYERKLNLQIWKKYADKTDIYIEVPTGELVGPFNIMDKVMRYNYEGGRLLTYYGLPTPYNVLEEIYVDFIPDGDYILSGIYKIYLVPKRIVEGGYEMWLPSNVVIGEDTRFLNSTPEGTLTIPSTSIKAVTVGAYNDMLDVYAQFSGRGFAGGEKPDIVAPGTDIITAKAGGGYETVSGTSFATPIVSGGAALLMEQNIVRGNDVYFYGERLKASLIAGANPLPGFSQYPNLYVGYGKVCIRNSV